MPDLYLQPQRISIEAAGTIFVPRVYGNRRADGTWEAWIEFHPVDGGAPRITDRETTQPTRAAVEYWVTGLEPVYFEGAFQRAVELPTR
jgi:hypothetical protein